MNINVKDKVKDLKEALTSLLSSKKLMSAVLVPLSLAYVTCSDSSSGGSDGGYIAPAPSNPGNSGNTGGGNNAGGDVSDNPSGETTPTYKYASVSDFLKQNITNYDELSNQISSTEINLTAQTIDTIVDEIWPALQNAVKNSNNEAKAESTFKSKANTNDIKNALIAIVGNKLKLSKTSKEFRVYKTSGSTQTVDGYGYSITTSGSKVALSGSWGYTSQHIDSVSKDVDVSKLNIIAGSANGNTVVVPSLHLEAEIYNRFYLADKTVDKYPTLNFGVTDVDDINYGFKHFMDIYDKYNSSEKMKITGTFDEMNGRYLGGATQMFSGNSEMSNIYTKDINWLITFASKYKTDKFYNMKITGSPASVTSTSWNFTNIIFTGDMSQLKNTGDLKGVIYFKNKPFSTSNSIQGVYKLDVLPSDLTIKSPSASGQKGVFDFREVDITTITNYDNTNLFTSNVYAIYFNENIKSLFDKGSAAFYKKFVASNAGVYNIYFGANRQDGDIVNTNNKSHSTARSLEEFEYYGNNHSYPDGGVALNNIKFIDANTNESILWIFNNRQYNG